MGIVLRIILIFFSLLYFGYTVLQIRRSHLNIEDAIFPIVFSLLCILMSIFTKVVSFISMKLGFISVSNFVLVFIIAVLSIYNLKLIVKFSYLKEKLKSLNHSIALIEKEKEK